MKKEFESLKESTIKYYEEEKVKIEEWYKEEIDKKHSLLAENEYNLQEKEKEIQSMQKYIDSLSQEIESTKSENEEMLKITEQTYIDKIEQVKKDIEEDIVNKVLPLFQ